MNRYVRAIKGGDKAKVMRDFGNGAVSVQLKSSGRYQMFHWNDLTEISEEEYTRR